MCTFLRRWLPEREDGHVIAGVRKAAQKRKNRSPFQRHAKKGVAFNRSCERDVRKSCQLPAARMPTAGTASQDFSPIRASALLISRKTMKGRLA